MDYTKKCAQLVDSYQATNGDMKRRRCNKKAVFHFEEEDNGGGSLHLCSEHGQINAPYRYNRV